MNRQVTLVGLLVLAAGLVGLASPQDTHQVQINLHNIYDFGTKDDPTGEAPPDPKDAGHNVALYIGNSKIVSPPTDAHGKTTLTLPNLPAGGTSLDAYYCKDGRYVLVEHGMPVPPDSGCVDPKLVGVIPLIDLVTGITINSDFISTESATTHLKIATDDYGHTSVYSNGAYLYDIGPGLANGDNTVQLWWTGPDGTLFYYAAIPVDEIGQPREQYEGPYGPPATIAAQPTGEPVPASVQQSSQNGGTGAPSSSPATTPAPATTPTHGKSELGPSYSGAAWAGLGANRLTHYGLAALLFLPAGPLAPRFGKLLFDSAIPQARPQQQQQISYSLVANGNSTGEAFALYVNDPSGRMKTIPLPPGTILEPTGKRLANPAAADTAGQKQPVNFYCYQFHKQPPAPGMLYRIADPGVQEANEPARYVLAAVDWLNAEGKLHPDIEIPQYLDALRQYAVWTMQEKWDQKAFTENWIERTKKNAQNLNVKWTKEMEKTLRAAAPGRWSDISPALDMANKMERVRKRILSGPPPGQKQKP